MVVDVLKCAGQWPRLMQVLVISMNLLRHVLFLIILLRCFQDSLSGLEVKVLLHFSIVLMSSSFEKGTHLKVSLLGNSSNNCELV